MNLNKVMLIGRLTRDPEMRYTPSGSPVTSFSLATNRYGQTTDGEKKEYTDYHNVVVWNIGKRNLAEICGQYLHKGSLVYVEGRLQTRSWEGQDGQKRKTTEVNATEIQFLEPRSQQSREPAAEPVETAVAAAAPAGRGEVPSRGGEPESSPWLAANDAVTLHPGRLSRHDSS